MIRPLVKILEALALVPVSPEFAEQYGPHVQALADEHSFDPFTMVSMGRNESRWRPYVVNVRGSEEYVGVFQIRLRNFDACEGDLLDGPCDATRRALQDWRFNATMAARHITWNREFCRETTGSAKFSEWLFSFGGFNTPGKIRVGSRVCGKVRTKRGWQTVAIPRPVWDVMEFRGMLVRRLG